MNFTQQQTNRPQVNHLPDSFCMATTQKTAILLSSPLLQKVTAIMSDMEYDLAPILGYAIIIFGLILSAVFWMLLFALIIRYSLDEQHLRVKLFGVFCISSIPYHEIKDIQVVPWWRVYWKEKWRDYFLTREWVGYEFRRTRVLITINGAWFRYVLIAPEDSAAFAADLSTRIPKIT